MSPTILSNFSFCFFSSSTFLASCFSFSSLILFFSTAISLKSESSPRSPTISLKSSFFFFLSSDINLKKSDKSSDITIVFYIFIQSGLRDSNPRPLLPKRSALPNCAKSGKNNASVIFCRISLTGIKRDPTSLSHGLLFRFFFLSET